MTNPTTNKTPSTPPPSPGATPKSPTPGPAASAVLANEASDDSSAGDADKDEKDANRSKLYIVVGEVHEFSTAAQAEKFLNQPGAPAKFQVLRGKRVESKQRVSLRG